MIITRLEERKTIKDIKNIVKHLRMKLKIKSGNTIDVCKILDLYKFEISPIEHWEDSRVHAYYNSYEKKIYIREDIYERACNNYGRDRMTITHEIGHHILHSDCSISEIGRMNNSFCCANKEWQAKVFAGEFLCPSNYSLTKMSIEKISKKFGISTTAAEIQKNRAKKLAQKRKEEKK